MTVIAFLGAGLLPGISAQESSVQTAAQSEMNLPAQWDLQSCIDYALQQNITIRKNRVNAESTQIDVKTAKATLFPSLSFSTSQNMVNRPYQESSRTISGSEVIETTSKTSYNGNYGLNASWTIYNGSKRLNTIKQEKLNNQAANLAMDNTKLVAELCDIIDRMNVILQAQAMELAQLHALHHEEEIAAVRRDYAQAIGEVST